MAWVKANPTNDELLTNFPAQCRANWEALELGTDTDLKITNAKCADNMALVDTKLAQIATAAKVSGAAITLLASVPSGAGVLPDVNLPHKLKADAADTTPQFLDSLINTDMFQISAGDLLELKFASIDHGSFAGLLDDDHTQYVKKTGNETIAGIKTFSSIPVLPASNPTTDNQATRKKYVIDSIAAATPITAETASAANTQVGQSVYTDVVTVTKTITSGKTVLILAHGFVDYNLTKTYLFDINFRLAYGPTPTVLTTQIFNRAVNVFAANGILKQPVSLHYLVTGLSGSTEFKFQSMSTLGATIWFMDNVITVLEF